MIAIFADTTTWLSEEFLVKIPSSVLNLAIENLNSISGVHCKQIKGDVKLSGNWEALITAHTLLQHCLEVNSDDADDDKKHDVDDSVDDVIVENETSVKPPTVFTIKKEKDADWLGSTSSTLNTKKSVSKFGRQRTSFDYADDDTQDIDIEEITIKKEIKTRSSKRNAKVAKKKGKYQCTKCDYIGKLEKQLENHMNRKHLRKYKCSDCGKKYGLKADLSRHRQEVHVDRDKYFCKICNKYLKTKGYIEDHMQLHNDDYVYHCKVCEKSFSTKLIFAKHIKIKHPKMKSVIREIEEALPSASKATVTVKEENPPAVTESAADSGNDSTQSEDKKSEQIPEQIQEQTPDNKLNTSQIMMENMLSPEGNDKVLHETELFKVSLKRGRNRGRPRIKSFMDERTEFKCHLCDYIGKKECHLEYHIKRNHSQKLICDICNKQFGYNWDLKRHREQVHADASFFCHICSKAYKVKKSFDEHLRSHEEGYVKSRYPCPECDKTFSAKQVLDNHMKYKHLGVKQKEKQRYLCQTCGQEFYHKYSYLSHMNKHQGLLPYNCDVCGKAFASEHSVKEHQIVHRDTRNHICKFCPKTFKTSSALKAHEAIHSNERSFKCNVCGKGFVQKQSLLRHERIHSGYKPYKCRLCDRPFTDSATVRKHMILVHKKDPHNWQGDVLSDLKRPREFWPEDLEIDAKNPKAMHYVYKGKYRLSTEQAMETNPDTSTPTCDPGQNTMYTNMPNMAPLHDPTRPTLHHSDPNMMVRTEPLSLVQQPPVSMHLLTNAAPPPPPAPQPVANSLPSSMVHMSHQDHISGHTSPPNSAVEIAAASILNLSSQLPPLPTPMSHISPVTMDGQMPSILNLSTMHNMSYNHHGTN